MPLADASADVIVVGQAWHWFDATRALAEVERVLVSGGGLGLLWNGSFDETVPWAAALAAIRDRRAQPGWPDPRNPDWHLSFRGRTGWSPLVERVFTEPWVTSRDDLVQRMLSSSVIASLPTDEHDVIRHEVLAVLDRYEETRGQPVIAVPYRTHLARSFHASL